MSHDIVDNSRLRTALGTEGLVVASRVEVEFANERSVLADDADVLVGDQEMDAESAVVSAEADVVEPAQVEGDDPCLVDTVVADQGSHSFTVDEGNFTGLGIVDQRQIGSLNDIEAFIDQHRIAGDAVVLDLPTI